MPSKKGQQKKEAIKKEPQKFVENDEQEELENNSILDKIISMPEDEIIPWEEVELPSLGLFYDSELMKIGVVKVRAMNLAIEKALANQRLAKSGQALDIMLKKCVKLPDPEFDHADLLIGDRYYLMFLIRGITYGNEYDFTLRCPHCNQEGIYKYDLNDLFSTLKKADENTEYPIRVKLPYLSKIMETEITVGVRYTTGRDLESVFKSRFENRRARPKRRLENTVDGLEVKSDDDIDIILKKSIVDVNGDTDKFKIAKFIDKLHSKDLSVINEVISDNQPGIDTTIMVQCSHCGEQIGPVALPITDKFFRTASSRGSGESV